RVGLLWQCFDTAVFLYQPPGIQDASVIWLLEVDFQAQKKAASRLHSVSLCSPQQHRSITATLHAHRSNPELCSQLLPLCEHSRLGVDCLQLSTALVWWRGETYCARK
ncbi:unnamed protein product, partial [Ectocarpus sp. 4 AP-2014]